MKHYLIFEFPTIHVEIWFANCKLASSIAPTLLKEIGGLGHDPIYYFNHAEVNLSLLKKNDFFMYCYLKGRSSFWSFEGFKQSVWSYPETLVCAKAIEGKIAFDPRVFKLVVHG